MLQTLVPFLTERAAGCCEYAEAMNTLLQGSQVSRKSRARTPDAGTQHEATASAAPRNLTESLADMREIQAVYLWPVNFVPPAV